jgi:hypothetical protein
MSTLAAVTLHGRFDARTVLESRYPFSDFSDYLLFIEACRGKKTYQQQTHNHHICPKKQFPKYRRRPDNQIRLTVAQHVHAHDLLSMAVLELYVPPRYIRRANLNSRRTGIAVAKRHKENGTGMYGWSPEQRRQYAVIGGLASTARTPEHQRKASRSALHKRWHVKRGRVSATCSLCVTVLRDSEGLGERHER